MPTEEVLTSVVGSGAISAVLGFCAGYAAKKVVKIVVVVAGVGILALGALSYYGLIQARWARIQQLAVNTSHWAYTQGVGVEHHLAGAMGSDVAIATGGGFLLGFAFGVQRG